MPYITPQRREELENPLEPYVDPGDLTYGLYVAAITEDGDFTSGVIGAHVARYINNGEPKYERYALVLGCLYSCALELDRQQSKHLQSEYIDYADLIHCYAIQYYRDVIAPYEDTKIEQNGDVLPCD